MKIANVVGAETGNSFDQEYCILKCSRPGDGALLYVLCSDLKNSLYPGVVFL
jgi:hypothetical protein